MTTTTCARGRRTQQGITGTLFALSLLITWYIPAEPAQADLLVSIDDHDFNFDVPLTAEYDYAGSSPDHFYVNTPGGHYASQYTYTGAMGTVSGPLGTPPAASPDGYPLYSGSPVQSGANVAMDMYYAANIGGSTTGNPNNIILVGTTGSLTITGRVATQSLPWADVTLLQITFSQVGLASVAGSNVAHLTGEGTVQTLLGVNVSSQDLTGAVSFDYYANSGSPSLFTSGYNPLAATDESLASGRASGEAGLSPDNINTPEPATLALLLAGGLGSLGVLPRVRRRALAQKRLHP
jgi:hypothetical protein